MINQSWLDEKLAILEQRQEHISNEVVKKMITRINEIGTLLPSDVYTLQQLYKSGADVREINKLIAVGTALQVKDIKRVIQEVARDIYVDAKPYYDYRRKAFIPYKDNKALQMRVNAIAKETNDAFKNLSNSRATGFMMKDDKTNKVVFMNMEQTYQTVVDKSIQTLTLTQGVSTYKDEIRKTVNQLVKSGVQGIYWDSGYHQRLDTAVRRNILDGVRKVSLEVERQIGKDINADGIELSAHFISAPDHEPVQGHCFAIKEFDKLQNEESFEDIYHNKFSAIRRPIGEWNCRHTIKSVCLDVYKPLYTIEELEEFKEENEKGYTTPDGRHYTLYECTQIQRQMETEIRRLKDRWLAYKELDDTNMMAKIEREVREQSAEYRQFSKDCGLGYNNGNLSVSGYKKG